MYPNYKDVPSFDSYNDLLNTKRLVTAFSTSNVEQADDYCMVGYLTTLVYMLRLLKLGDC